MVIKLPSNYFFLMHIGRSNLCSPNYSATAIKKMTLFSLHLLASPGWEILVFVAHRMWIWNISVLQWIIFSTCLHHWWYVSVQMMDLWLAAPAPCRSFFEGWDKTNQQLQAEDVIIDNTLMKVLQIVKSYWTISAWHYLSDNIGRSPMKDIFFFWWKMLALLKTIFFTLTAYLCLKLYNIWRKKKTHIVWLSPLHCMKPLPND